MSAPPANTEPAVNRARNAAALRADHAPLGLDEDRRPLGEAEHVIHRMHRMGTFTAAGVAHIRGRLTPELTRRALDWLQQQNPLLRAHIVSKGFRLIAEPPFFSRPTYFETRGTEPIPLREVIDPDPGAWIRVLDEEVRTVIAMGRNPRLRAVLVRGSPTAETCQLVIAVDHCIADAQAAMIAIRQLLEFIGDPHDMPAPLGRYGKLPPALETVLPKPAEDPSKPYQKILRLPARHFVRAPRRTGLEVRRFSVAETDVIRELIKVNRTTVHGIVTAAVLKAIHAHFGVDRLTCLSSVEFRRQAQPPLPPETFGCYIDLLRTVHDLDKPIWALSQDVAFKLITAMARHRGNASVIKRPTLGTYLIEAIPTLLSHLRVDGLAMTTAGETNLRRQYGPFELEEITGLVSQNRFGVGMFGMAMERLGALELSLGYAAHTLPQADAVAVADLTADMLRTLPR